MTEPLQTILDSREAVIKILERDAQDAHDKLANAAPPVQVPNSIRVPLDSLHADAEYLLARLLAGTLTREQVVGVIRDRIDAARLEIESLQSQLAAIGAGGVEPLRKCLHQIAEPGCTRSHPHEAMSPECRIRAVIAEMRNREARGAEATEHCLGRFADVLERALSDRAMQAQAAPAAVAGPSEFPHEQMDAMALARYKVVPSTSSMFWSHAVVAGDGAQQLYVGREVECQNMVRKFAGAFLDGAFAFHSIAADPTTQAAPVAQGDADPLQGAAQWLLEALEGCNIADLQSRLFIGFNRAERLMLGALAARSQAKEGASHG